ncbi:hypothetical protein [Mycobacterium sp. 29Ha]|uniref:hypothetical protein n=1 Tax=Mycobacterium sp. 29Ha TaxID=2939268 RepID=UPI00293921C1|nr:hypothetical protein [Mycobacterium sp. 29Ha]MDV3135325.1 hypothetical protein [Mycobacterium sp. 29Ha]
MAPFTDAHLKRLLKIAREDERRLFERNPHLAVYRDRLLLVALCQGGGLHYVDCQRGVEKRNGVKDLDVYTFYSEHSKTRWPYRRHGVADFGESEFGYHPGKRKDFVGRHVDLLGRALPVRPDANPVEAVRKWLTDSNNKTPRLLRTKGVVGLHPGRLRGQVIWDPYAEGYR